MKAASAKSWSKDLKINIHIFLNSLFVCELSGFPRHVLSCRIFPYLISISDMFSYLNV